MKMSKFRMGDLFEKLKLKNTNGFDKSKDVSKVKTKEFCVPLVNAKMGENGIMFYGRESQCPTATMTIDIVQNGAVAAGRVYAQPDATGVLWDAYLIKPKWKNVTIEQLLYLAPCIEKVTYEKYSRYNLATWKDKVKNDYIYLPVIELSDENHIYTVDDIDFKYMENYISELEEERISELEEYLSVTGLDGYELTKEDKELLSLSLQNQHLTKMKMIRMLLTMK